MRLSVLRIVTGALFMQHGVQKLFGLLAPERTWNGAPAPFSQLWIAGALEVFGGALIVAGLFTRPVAFLLAGEMAVAYFQAHNSRSFFPALNGGESDVPFCFGISTCSLPNRDATSSIIRSMLRRRRHAHAGGSRRERG